MSREVDREACPICGEIPYDADRRVLVIGKVRLSYCSQACLNVGVRTTQKAQRKARLRRYALLLAFALVAAGAGYLRHLLLRVSRLQQQVVASAPEPTPPETLPEEIPFGPHWPPTDDDWLEQFARADWVYPLPGPVRRRPAISPQLVGVDPVGSPRARCRTASHCGVDLGGELWGEHVYAALDGVVDRLQRTSEDAPGGVYVRIAHWGGVVFTHYFHLAATPTRLAVGAHVSAGDVIGLLGDTGLTGARAHLHFALSVRPSNDLPEVYWDPDPLMTKWPLRIPERGSVAGLVSIDAPPDRVAGTPSVVHHLPTQQPPRSRRTAPTSSDHPD
jgi:murein DD-endopeptidase MepM/ murein hydrolase activator NlpD